MKYFSFFVTLVFALFVSVQAAPATVGQGHELAVREVSMMQETIDNINDYVQKREYLDSEELQKRESQIVTDVLRAVRDTNLAVPILQYLTTDDTLRPIAINTITYLIKNDIINLGTLLKSLNDSGLAVEVIQNLISDCSFYADIYQLALGYIRDLAQQIGDRLTGNSKREFMMVEITPKSMQKRADDDNDSPLLTSLMESLKNSGLADQVVRALVVDPDFLDFGADLIRNLIDEDAISIGELIDALLDSGLVPSLIEAFLNLGTFNTVITNALAAAFGRCDGSSVTASITEASSATPTASGSATPTATRPSVCRKKKRSY